MATAIEFDNISKQYRLGLVSTKTLTHDIRRFWITNVLGKEDPYLKIGETNDRSTKGNSEYVWALKDINFKIEQGDVVGIIGKNGAGKSTLLKLLSRVTGPTTGTIKARGRIGSLLEVGTGFHAEMTGRENIYLNGAILGMTHQEISRKLDEIVDFSGCERYIDTPVKRYSSGMMVRLGFAVAAHLDPEILVVDEVLAVGDAEFQKKAIGKMQDVSKGEGRTVLFVSHNMNSVRTLCHRGIVLNNGSVAFDDTIEKAVEYYLVKDKNVLNEQLSNRTDRCGNKKIFVTEIISSNFQSEKSQIFYSGEYLKLSFRVEMNGNVDLGHLLFNCSLCDVYDKPIVSWESKENNVDFSNLKNDGVISIIVPHLDLRPGTYYVYYQLSEKNYEPDNWCDLLNKAYEIKVENSFLLSESSLLTILDTQAIMRSCFEIR